MDDKADRQRGGANAVGDKSDEETATTSGARGKSGQDVRDDDETQIHAWLAWADASRILMELLSEAAGTADTGDCAEGANRPNNKRLDDVSACMTAGVIDHLVRHGKEVLQKPALLHRLRDTHVEETARRLISMI